MASTSPRHTNTETPNNNVIFSPKPITRSEPGSPFPTTFVQADTSSFKQVVQFLTGNNSSDHSPKPHTIPPIKNTPKKHHHHHQQQSSSSSGFRLYERRNSLGKNLKINPFMQSSKQEIILSPSILDFPSLVLSPVTPLIADPFDRNGVVLDSEAEEKAIKEKGFFLHPSPGTTPRDIEPRLLPLFPLTSPKVSGSSSSTTSSHE